MSGPQGSAPERGGVPRPAPAGWVALSLALSLTVFRPAGDAHLLLSWCVWAAVAVGFVGAWVLPLSALRLQRHPPAVATSGRRFLVTYVLDYRGRRGVFGLRLLQPGFPHHPLELDLLPGARPVVSLPLLPLRRGSLELGPPLVEVHGPLGLFLRRAAVPLAVDRVLIRPNPRPPRAVHLRPWLRRGLDAGSWSTVRDWRPGDPRRWVHARCSARRDYPVVAPPERDPDPRLSLGVDPALPPRSFERAVSYAAGLGLALLGRGVTLDLLLEERIPCRGREGRAQLLDALADVAPERAGRGDADVLVSVEGRELVLRERAP